MDKLEELKSQVRQSGTLSERLRECRSRIAAMCKEGRPPKMTIPVQWYDDDFFISTTIEDAQNIIGEGGKCTCWVDSNSPDVAALHLPPCELSRMSTRSS